METQLMRLSIGSAVRCRDGMAGRLKYVVIDPDDGKVTNLIVKRGRLLRRDIVVPTAWVEKESEGEIVLNATTEDLNKLPEYKEFEFIQPDPSYRPLSGHRVEDTRFWSNPYDPVGYGRPWILRHVRVGVQDDEVVIQRGLPVHDQDRRPVGTIDHLVVDSKTHKVTHFVVRRGSLLDPEAHILPLEWVSLVSEVGVRLNMPVEELDQAPLYHAPATDEQITFALQRALETDPRTREAGLRVEVQQGVVRFFGTMTDTVKDAARSIARRLRGVIGFTEDMVEPEPGAARKQRL